MLPIQFLNLVLFTITVFSAFMMGYSVRGIQTILKIKKVYNSIPKPMQPEEFEALSKEDKLSEYEKGLEYLGKIKVVPDILAENI